MNYRRLGRSGLTVSALGLGCNAFGSRADAASAHRILSLAHERGITLYDTADIYSGSRSEEIVGQWLTSAIRDEIVISTKGGGRTRPGPGGEGASRAHLPGALDASLKRLRTDHVDLYHVHFHDSCVPREETLAAMDSMVRSGKVRYVAVSNHPAWEIALQLGVADRRLLSAPVSTQCSYSLVDRTAELELIPLCLDQGLGLLTYWPLGGGLLTGKYGAKRPAPEGSRLLTQPIFQQSFTPERLAFADEFTRIAAQSAVSPSALALTWVLARPGVSSVLVGATRTEQLRQNLEVVDAAVPAGMLDQLTARSEHSRYTPFRPGGTTAP